MLVRRLLLGAALLVLAFGGINYLHNLRDLVPVVVATADIPAHTRLTAGQLVVRQVHRDAVATLAPHAIQKVEEATGLVTQTELHAGDVLRKEPWLVVMPPAGADPADARYYIPDGMRLASVHVDTAGAVGGRVSPGDRVDVLFTTKDANGATSAETLLQGIEVFAVGTRTKSTGSDSTGQDVTLLVTPADAQTLALAKRSGGSIDLSIAPPSPTPVDLPSSTLPGASTPPAAAAQAGGTPPRR